MITEDHSTQVRHLTEALVKIANGEVLAFQSPSAVMLVEQGWLTPAGHISTAGIGCLANQTKPVNLLTLLFAAGFRVMREGERNIQVGHEHLGYAAAEWGTWRGMFCIIQWARGSVIGRGPWVLYLREDEVEKFQASVQKAAAGQSFVVCTNGDDVRGKMAHGECYLTTIKGVAIVRESSPATAPAPVPVPVSAIDTRMGCAERAAQGRAKMPSIGSDAERAVREAVSTREMVSAQKGESLAEAVWRWAEQRVGTKAPLTLIVAELERRAGTLTGAGPEEVMRKHMTAATASLRAVANGEKPEVRIQWRTNVKDFVTDLQEHLGETELHALQAEIASRVGAKTNWEALYVSHDAEIRAALRANEGESTLAAAFRVAGRGPALPIFLSQLVEKALLAYLAETSESPHARHKVALQGNIARGRVELHSMRAESVYP